MKKINLFLYSLYISSTTIGGGFVIISVIRKIFVEKLKIISEDDMLEITSLAQSAPGAVAVNSAVTLGYRLAGVGGAFLAVAGTVLPPLVIMTAISALYGLLGDFRSNHIVSGVMRGMQAGVSAIVLDAAVNMTVCAMKSRVGGSPSGSLRVLKPLVLVSAVTAQIIFGVGSVYIVLAAAGLGILSYFIDMIMRKGGSVR